jgi:hypothetical protein
MPEAEQAGLLNHMAMENVPSLAYPDGWSWIEA